MKFSFDRNYIAAIITLVFVVFCGGIYSLIYVPGNEKNLQEQRFRTLQNIDENLHKKLDNSLALMNNLLTTYARNDSLASNVNNYLDHYSKENFTLTQPVKTLVHDIPPGDFTDSRDTISINNDHRLITLNLIKNIAGQQDTISYRMSMGLTFDQFVQHLFPQDVFDQYLVFSNNQLVYETFRSGITYLDDSLINKKNGIEISSVRSLNVSGKDYKLFSQPVTLSSNGEWVVIGLLSNSRYANEKNQLPTGIVLLLVTIVFVIILSFPWMKLYQMGSKDRLTITDGISTIAVSMLLMSILFFAFFKYNLVLRPDKSLLSNDTLAAQITRSFHNELDTAYQKLTVFDDSVANNPEFLHDIINLNTDSIQYRNSGARANAAHLRSIAGSLRVSQVFWLDKKGDEQANWIATDWNAPHGNFRAREYFKRIITGNPYLFDRDSSRKYFLDQVVSWISGAFTSVVAIPSRVPGEAVAALSFNFRSLFKPVLPAGYRFAIIDDSGQVLYHSEASRNLSENLLDEFSEKDELAADIEARTAGVFNTTYFGSDYDVSVHPIDNLPYFIVLLSDASFRETRDTEIYSFTFSMMFLFFAFLMMELFVVFLVSSKRSFFKMQLHDTSWIGPKISSHRQYNLAALFNLFVIALVLAFFSFATFLAYLFILLFSVTFIGVFLAALFARRYQQKKQDGNYQFKRKTLLAMFVTVLIIDVAALRILEPWSLLMVSIYELLAVIVGWLFFKYGDRLVVIIRERTPQTILSGWNYKHSFSLMGVTRLIVTSGIPILFFYMTSYNYEQNISIRHRQLQYASQLFKKLSGRPFEKFPDHNSFSTGCYTDGAWIDTIFTGKPTIQYDTSREEKISKRLLGLFRINISSVSVKEQNFDEASASDTSFFYNPLLKDACATNGKSILYMRSPKPDKYLAIASSSLNYKVPSIFARGWFGASLFWLMLFFALAVFYLIIYKIISKLFCVNLPDLGEWSSLDDTVIGAADLNKLIFIIGLPGSGKLSIIQEKIKNGAIHIDVGNLVYEEDNDSASNVFVADLINIADKGDDRESDARWVDYKARTFAAKNKLIIVNHFEYNIQDAATNRVKLNFLESLMLDSKCKIIILSTVHPVSFLDSIMEQVVDKAGANAPGQDLERWHVLLGHYRIVVFPLQQSRHTNDIAWDAIYKETQQTHFLIKMQPYAIDIAKKLTKHHLQVNGDELAFKLQITAHYFYMYIWQSLTKEEKFLLYDLAEDNLVNSYNDYDLNMLLAKGIIIRPDGTLKLFNKGFRNFILTAIGNSEAMKIRKNIKDSGNWNKLKNPLIILVLAILAFLLTSQQEVYSKLISYAAALTAGLPVILKLFSFFGKSDQKNN